jgi:hypothetical protein
MVLSRAIHPASNLTDNANKPMDNSLGLASGMATPYRSRPSRPLGVTILAIVQFLSGLNALGSSLFFFAVSSLAETASVQQSLQNSPWVAENAGSIFFWLGLIFLALAIWSLWYARGFFKGQEWARRRGRRLAVLTIIFAILLVIFLPNLPQKVGLGSPWWMVISNTVVAVYLGRPKVIAFFKSRTA